MSSRRLVITAVVVEGRTHAEVAERYGLSRSWVTRLVGRYRTDGEAAFEPRSRRPLSNPNQVSDVVNNQILNLRDYLSAQGLDAGPETIRWHLQQHHQTTVSVSTIRRRLVVAGRITPRTTQTAKEQLHPLRGRPAKRDLANRCHPLLAWPTTQRPSQPSRDPHLARRPLPLRTLGHRPLRRQRPHRHQHIHKRC
jgi:hypothetical protein